MLVALCLAALVAISCAEEAKHTQPTVRVYSYKPGEFGVKNTLICHVSGFHPPDIEIQLMKDGVEIPDAQQTDLAFSKGWNFHLTKNVAFIPEDGQKYLCKVTHGGKGKDYLWEPDM